MRLSNHEMYEKIEQIMKGARSYLASINDGRMIHHRGKAFGDLRADTELVADYAMGKYFYRALKDLSALRYLEIEGGDCLQQRPPGATGWKIFVDPLDGSLCYKLCDGHLGLPYTAVVQVFLVKDEKLTFGDLQHAAILDYRSGDLWTVFRDLEWRWQTRLNGQPVRTLGETKLDIGSQIVIMNMHYPRNRELIGQMFQEPGWLTNCKSAAYEMALVASGTAAAYICSSQKHHELAAGVAMVLGAGGIACDFVGNSYLYRDYDFGSQSPVILAANEEIVEDILVRLRSPY